MLNGKDNGFHTLAITFMDYVSSVCNRNEFIQGTVVSENWITQYKMIKISILFETDGPKLSQGGIIKRISFYNSHMESICNLYCSRLNGDSFLFTYGGSSMPDDLSEVFVKKCNEVNFDCGYSTEDLISFLDLLFGYYCKSELRAITLKTLLDG